MDYSDFALSWIFFCCYRNRILDNHNWWNTLFFSKGEDVDAGK